jgi:hypothetical protein
MSIEDGHVNFYFHKLLREAIEKQWIFHKEEIENISYTKFVERLIWKGLKR